MMSPELPPIVFLDVDGVLNISRRIAVPRPALLRRNGTPYRRPPLWRTVWQFEASAINALASLVDATGARLVLTSTWRRRDDARERLAEHGVGGPWHDDWRTDDDGERRGDQIGRWFERNGDCRHVVIDDRDVGLEERARQLVRTAFRAGLTSEDAARAATLLDTPLAGPLATA